jgi:hypothetical protein
MKVTNEVLMILGQCEVVNQTIKLPDIQLDKKVYAAVNKVLLEMGGKWNRKAKAHCFYDNVDVQGIYSQTIETGEVVAVFKQIQFFETPLIVVEEILRHAKLGSGVTILEPSAGKGAIAGQIIEMGFNVCACEKHDPFIKILRDIGCSLLGRDFLQYEPTKPFDRILANPPFTKQQDIKHVNHMLDCLAVGGRLVTVMSSGFEFRADKLTIGLKDRLDESCDWHSFALPEGSFKESGTNVSTILLVADKL